ncbi:MAG: hypothetical protein ACI8TP_003699 [Acidimicrobiales bacterium]|jgi:hypothetical protein
MVGQATADYLERLACIQRGSPVDLSVSPERWAMTSAG